MDGRMSVRSRAGWLGRWGGLAVLFCIAAAWGASGLYRVSLYIPSSSGYRGWYVGFGMVGGSSSDSGSGRIPPAPFHPGFPQSQQTRVVVESAPDVGLGICHWHLTPQLVGVSTAPWGRTRYSGTNLWLVFVLTAVPVAILWRQHLRAPPGHCRKCRYSLAGVTGDVCPECGAEKQA